MRTGLLFAFAIWGGSLVAQPSPADSVNTQDNVWAKRTGLTASQIREMRIASGLTDSTLIQTIDTASLKDRHQILFAEAAPCLRVHVLEHRGDGFRQIWTLTKLPLPSWTHGGQLNPPETPICGRATVHVTAEKQIVIEVSILMDPFERPAPVSTFSFAWDGHQYKLAGENR